MPTRRRVVTVRDPWVLKNSRLPLHPDLAVRSHRRRNAGIRRRPFRVFCLHSPAHRGRSRSSFAFLPINAPRVAYPAFRLERCSWPDRVFSPINAGRNRRKNRLILRRFYGLNALTVLLAFSRNAGRFLS